MVYHVINYQGGKFTSPAPGTRCIGARPETSTRRGTFPVALQNLSRLVGLPAWVQITRLVNSGCGWNFTYLSFSQTRISQESTKNPANSAKSPAKLTKLPKTSRLRSNSLESKENPVFVTPSKLLYNLRPQVNQHYIDTAGHARFGVARYKGKCVR